MTRLVLFESFVTNLLLFVTNDSKNLLTPTKKKKKKMLVRRQFSGPDGVTKYGSG